MTRLQTYLNEKWHSRIREYGTSYEVFTNPSAREIRNILNAEDKHGNKIDAGNIGMIKFVADKRKKKIYVWNYFGPLHDEGWQSLMNVDLEFDVYNGDIVPGYAEMGGSKWVMTDADGDKTLDNYIHDINDKKAYIASFKWADIYINITKYLANQRYGG